jgi:hypothetical protein
MSITETKIGMSPLLYDKFRCFTPVKASRDDIYRASLVLRSEYLKDRVYWETGAGYLRPVIVADMEEAARTVDFYAKRYPFAVDCPISPFSTG